jgi:hypothetical protein
MSTQKYYYVIVEKENGKMILEDAKLPIYYNKKVAKEVCKNWGSKYCVHPIIAEKLNHFILIHY